MFWPVKREEKEREKRGPHDLRSHAAQITRRHQHTHTHTHTTQKGLRPSTRKTNPRLFLLFFVLFVIASSISIHGVGLQQPHFVHTHTHHTLQAYTGLGFTLSSTAPSKQAYSPLSTVFFSDSIFIVYIKQTFFLCI